MCPGSGLRATSDNGDRDDLGAMSNEILALRAHLIAEKVTCVVMESTGDYWKPFYYLLEDAVNVMLVNPRDARNRPGRKTDVSDVARRPRPARAVAGLAGPAATDPAVT